ncbi:MAG: hypothetical protein LKF47_02380, partial [Megasphaera sp.]|nr:hypothetical protein [Megasphaera sp.]
MLVVKEKSGCWLLRKKAVVSSYIKEPRTAFPRTALPQQPTTNNQQPTTNNQQPTTNNQQPTTNNYLFNIERHGYG